MWGIGFGSSNIILEAGLNWTALFFWGLAGKGFWGGLGLQDSYNVGTK